MLQHLFFLQVLMTYWNMNEFEVRAARFQFQYVINQTFLHKNVGCYRLFITRLASLITGQGGGRNEGVTAEVARHRRVR